MRGFLESRSEGSTVGGGAPFLIYSPRHPHQRLERGQEKRQKDSLRPPDPETKFSSSKLPRSKSAAVVCPPGVRAHRPAPCPPVAAAPLQLAVRLVLAARLLQMHPSPVLLCQEL